MKTSAKDFFTNKSHLIVIGIILAALILIVGIFINDNNKAVNLEEQINASAASVKVQEKRRVDLIYNLADTAKAYAKYESSTLQQVTEARSKASSGNIDEAKVALNAVAEQYPNLKANENYKSLMNELALTENMIAEHRNDYNVQVRSYNKFVRSFPASAVLNVMGYDKKDFTYTDYNASTSAPTNLFADSSAASVPTASAPVTSTPAASTAPKTSATK